MTMEDKKFNFELTVNELNVILSGLGELVLKISEPVKNNIFKQYQAQVVAEQMEKAKEGSKDSESN
jgi:hypothetical protein